MYDTLPKENHEFQNLLYAQRGKTETEATAESEDKEPQHLKQKSLIHKITQLSD